ncbi:MAG TPA: hypothetical protein VFY29_04135, partial [Terriglobia bacterium]|nr:hypothetical protein [Terriglobia bacterium]
ARAGKDFELVVIPGADHGASSPITTRKRNDFFVKNLLGLDPPNWNVAAASAPEPAQPAPADSDAAPWVASEWWDGPGR